MQAGGQMMAVNQAAAGANKYRESYGSLPSKCVIMNV